MKIRNYGFKILILTIMLLVSSLVFADGTTLSSTHTRFNATKIEQVRLGLFFATSDVVKKSQPRLQNAYNLTCVLHLLPDIHISRYNPIGELALIKEGRYLYAA
jgi:hypothetical protein